MIRIGIGPLFCGQGGCFNQSLEFLEPNTCAKHVWTQGMQKKHQLFCKPPIHTRLHTCTLSRDPSHLLIQFLTQCAFRAWFPVCSDPRYFSIPQPITSTRYSPAANFVIGHLLISATSFHDHRNVFFPAQSDSPLMETNICKLQKRYDTNATQYIPIQTISRKINSQNAFHITFAMIHSFRTRIAHSPVVNVAHQVALRCHEAGKLAPLGRCL